MKLQKGFHITSAREKTLEKLRPRGCNAGLFPQMLIQIATALQSCSPNGNGKLHQIMREVLVLEGLDKTLQGLFTKGKSNTYGIDLDIMVHK